MTKTELLASMPKTNEDWVSQQFLLLEKSELRDYRDMFRLLINKTLYKSWAHNGMSLDEIHCILLEILGTYRWVSDSPKEKRAFKERLQRIPDSNKEWAIQMFVACHKIKTLSKFEQYFEKLTEQVLFKSWAKQNMTLLEISNALEKTLSLS